MTINTLLIDDDPDTRAIVALALDLHPDFTVSAVSRFEAAGILRDGRRRFDVILLDMKSADASAHDLVATTRQWSASTTVPMVILAPRARDIAHTYLAAGAQGMIAKPFDPVALPDRVIELIEPFVEETERRRVV
jgi:DNA-binding response OmpR family regulator